MTAKKRKGFIDNIFLCKREYIFFSFLLPKSTLHSHFLSFSLMFSSWPICHPGFHIVFSSGLLRLLWAMTVSQRTLALMTSAVFRMGQGLFRKSLWDCLLFLSGHPDYCLSTLTVQRHQPPGLWAQQVTFSASGFLLRKLQFYSWPEVTATVKKEKGSVLREHICGALPRSGHRVAACPLCPPSPRLTSVEEMLSETGHSQAGERGKAFSGLGMWREGGRGRQPAQPWHQGRLRPALLTRRAGSTLAPSGAVLSVCPLSPGAHCVASRAGGALRGADGQRWCGGLLAAPAVLALASSQPLLHGPQKQLFARLKLYN